MMKKDNKEWRVIEEAQKYEVSNYGDVRKISTKREIKGTLDRDGYPRVLIVNNEGKKITRFRHRLAAIAFLDNPDDLPVVNHKDESKDNSFVGTAENNYEDGNLEWCTIKYNVNYGTRTERQKRTIAAKAWTQGGGKPYKIEDIYVYDYTTKMLIKKFDNLTEAARELNCDRSTAYKVAQGQRRQTHNYIFSYVPLDVAG
jgi:hypothetical protein